MTERSQQNVAHGLAWSYYVGYLKIVLPRTWLFPCVIRPRQADKPLAEKQGADSKAAFLTQAPLSHALSPQA